MRILQQLKILNWGLRKKGRENILVKLALIKVLGHLVMLLMVLKPLPKIIVVHNCLHQHGVPALTITVTSMVHCRWCDWYVQAINCSDTLRNTHVLFESLGYCLYNQSPVGNWTYTGCRHSTMAAHISWTMMVIEFLATPQRCATLRYSQVVARTQRVMATLHSVYTHRLNWVSCLAIKGRNCWHRYRYIA